MRRTEPASGSGAASHTDGSRRAVRNALIILDVLRTLLAEEPQVIDELHTVITSHYAVPRILCPTRTGRAHERFILIENVVYADVDFPQLVAKDLLAHEQVAEQIAVVVIVRETQILDIRSAAREGESPAEDELERRRSLMVEITVLSSGSGEGIDGFVVCSLLHEAEIRSGNGWSRAGSWEIAE